MCSAAGSRNNGISRAAILRIGKKDALAGRRIMSPSANSRRTDLALSGEARCDPLAALDRWVNRWMIYHASSDPAQKMQKPLPW